MDKKLLCALLAIAAGIVMPPTITFNVGLDTIIITVGVATLVDWFNNYERRFLND